MGRVNQLIPTESELLGTAYVLPRKRSELAINGQKVAWYTMWYSDTEVHNDDATGCNRVNNER